MIAIETSKLVVDYRAREWCKLPYPGHPKGCPNFNKTSRCPPNALLIEQFININKPVWLIVVQFDLASHVEKMRAKHPMWSERQLRCVLYWQPAVNAQLRKDMLDFHKKTWLLGTSCPEAMGVNVLQTAKQAGIPILAHPKGNIFKIGLFGAPNE